MSTGFAVFDRADREDAALRVGGDEPRGERQRRATAVVPKPGTAVPLGSSSSTELRLASPQLRTPTTILPLLKVASPSPSSTATRPPAPKDGSRAPPGQSHLDTPLTCSFSRVRRRRSSATLPLGSRVAATNSEGAVCLVPARRPPRPCRAWGRGSPGAPARRRSRRRQAQDDARRRQNDQHDHGRMSRPPHDSVEPAAREKFRTERPDERSLHGRVVPTFQQPNSKMDALAWSYERQATEWESAGQVGRRLDRHRSSRGDRDRPSRRVYSYRRRGRCGFGPSASVSSRPQQLTAVSRGGCGGAGGGMIRAPLERHRNLGLRGLNRRALDQCSNLAAVQIPVVRWPEPGQLMPEIAKRPRAVEATDIGKHNRNRVIDASEVIVVFLAGDPRVRAVLLPDVVEARHVDLQHLCSADEGHRRRGGVEQGGRALGDGRPHAPQSTNCSRAGSRPA